MPAFTYRETEHHRMTRTYEYEFDTTSTEDWENLLESAEANNVDISEMPSEPPEDPIVWMGLIEQLPLSDLVDYDDDVWTMSKGGFDVSAELLDDEGNEIA